MKDARRAAIACVLVVLAAALAASAFASSTANMTTKSGDYVLRSADNSPPTGFTTTSNRFPTEDLCMAAAKAAVIAGTLKPGTFKCDHSTALTITVTSTCADEPAPRIYLPLVDLPDGNGAKGYELPEMEPPTLKQGSDSEYMPERQWLYVHNSAWPAGFPNCWVRGFEDPSKWRQNAVKDPGKVFLELITPQNAADAVRLPNSIEPVTTSAAFEASWLLPENEATRHEHYDCYPETDKTPCPVNPVSLKPSACGWYWETSCGGPGRIVSNEETLAESMRGG